MRLAHLASLPRQHVVEAEEVVLLGVPVVGRVPRALVVRLERFRDVAGVPQQHPEVVVRHRVGGRGGDGPLERLERHPRLALHRVHHAEVVQRLRERGVDGDGALVALHRALDVVPLAVQHPEVVPRLRAVRSQPKRGFVRDGGAVELPNLGQRHPEVVRRLGAVGVERERPLVRAHGERDVPARLDRRGPVPERDGEVSPPQRVIRRHGEAPFVRLDRARHVAAILFYDAHVAVRLGVVRVDLYRPRVALQRLVVASQLGHHHAEVVKRGGVPRVRGGGFPVMRHGLRGRAEHLDPSAQIGERRG